LGAFAIDAATVATLLWTLVVLHVLWFMDDWSDRLQPRLWGRGFVATVSFAVIAVAYQTVFIVANRGQTPGKDIMNLRVVPSSGPGDVGPGRAMVRSVPFAALVLVRPVSLLVGVAIALVVSLWTPGRRSLPDRLAATAVVSYDRDAEDATARRPSSRRRRLADRARSDVVEPWRRQPSRSRAARGGAGER
jgi:uncharacterized RDD family membrane protein YckC